MWLFYLSIFGFGAGVQHAIALRWSPRIGVREHNLRMLLWPMCLPAEIGAKLIGCLLGKPPAESDGDWSARSHLPWGGDEDEDEDEFEPADPGIVDAEIIQEPEVARPTASYLQHLGVVTLALLIFAPLFAGCTSRSPQEYIEHSGGTLPVICTQLPSHLFACRDKAGEFWVCDHNMIASCMSVDTPELLFAVPPKKTIIPVTPESAK